MKMNCFNQAFDNTGELMKFSKTGVKMCDNEATHKAINLMRGKPGWSHEDRPLCMKCIVEKRYDEARGTWKIVKLY